MHVGRWMQAVVVHGGLWVKAARLSPEFEPFCPVDTVLIFSIFFCVVYLLINKMFIHLFKVPEGSTFSSPAR